jgi:hypothetical protein
MSVDKKIDYVNQDGYKNYIKDSKSVTVPVKFKSKKDATPTKLAYITADEAKMLKKMKKNTPHKGPSGIPSYDDYDASRGDYGTATAGSQMSGFETGAKGERSRADARSLGMSPKDVQDIRGGALRAGAGQVTNPSFFGPRNRVSRADLRAAKAFAPGAYRASRGSPFGLGNIMSGIAGLMMGIPGFGLITAGLGSLKDKFSTNKDKVDYSDMEKFNQLGLYTNYQNPDYYDDFDNTLAINTEPTITPKEKPITQTTETDVLDYLNESP